MSSNCKETIKRSSGRFISFIKHAFSLVQSSHLTLYSCKYSRRDYTQHQLLAILLFKEYRKEDYRTVASDLEEMDRIRGVLELETIPHFTTLQKFFSRIKPIWFDILLKSLLKIFYFPEDRIPITAIDSSGFTSGYCSHYFSERTGKIRKHFLKTTIVVDIDQQVITGFRISKSRVHDSVHAFSLLKECHRLIKSDCYLMDRGYDSERMHRFIRESLKADSIIPARSHQYSKNVWGKYRKEMTDHFDAERYRKRFLVETKFSVLKRRFGSDLKSRQYQIQRKEIACKIILANLDRLIIFVWIKGFYRAEELNEPGTFTGGNMDEIIAGLRKHRVIMTAKKMRKRIDPVECNFINITFFYFKLTFPLEKLSNTVGIREFKVIPSFPVWRSSSVLPVKPRDIS